jgi:hypothetical protein
MDGGGGGQVRNVTLRTYTAGAKLMFTQNVEGGRGLPHPLPLSTTKQLAIGRGAWAQKLMYIKLPIYLFFIWRLDLMILMWANPLLRPLEGVGPEISTFLGPNGTNSLLPVPYKQQVHEYFYIAH